jgi:hypothetical protein
VCSSDLNFQICQESPTGQHRPITHDQLKTPAGLILWYKNCLTANNAFTSIVEKSTLNPPPIKLIVELTDLDSFELSHCVCIRTLWVFEHLIDHWLIDLKLEIQEEEIEQGPQVTDYLKKHGKTLQSKTLPALTP